jgi:hypothetical protein
MYVPFRQVSITKKSKKGLSSRVSVNKSKKNKKKKVVINVIFIKEYLDKNLVVCHSVGLTRHIVENGGKLTQELG